MGTGVGINYGLSFCQINTQYGPGGLIIHIHSSWVDIRWHTENQKEEERRKNYVLTMAIYASSILNYI